MKITGLALAVGCATVLCSASATAAIDDAKAQALMKSGGCATCHSADKKLVGPSYKDVAAKRKAEADAAAMLQKAVRTGSKDVYGKMPMPPIAATKISDDDLKELIAWILTK
jgi:cytochrome c